MTVEEKKSKLSVAILTFNSEAHIKACLESAKWADEIIVVDSFSSDKTLDVARGYTDRIWQRQWPGFARQWNFAIDKATGEWIFILASDERITPGLTEEINSILLDKTPANGYFVPRKTFFLNKWIKHCGWYPDYGVRLIKKGSGRFDESKLVHEAINIEGKTAYLKNPILHYSYSTVSEYIDRMNKYTSLAARQMLKDEVKIGPGKIRKAATHRLIKTFWKMYVRQLGFMDGMEGLFLSFFSSVYQSIVYAKYWECIKKNEATNAR